MNKKNKNNQTRTSKKRDKQSQSLTRAKKQFTKGSKEKAGRSKGKITVRSRGGGAKRKQRQVDFKQTKLGIPATVKAIEYDPNRSAYLALIVFDDGEWSYILAPQNLDVGDQIVYSENTKIKPGNRLKLKNIPVSVPIHNIEVEPNKGGQMVRSAGGSAEIASFESGYAHIKMPSTEVRKIPEDAFASIGQVSNPQHESKKLGKAGRARHAGKRPKVRGKAMNPVDHPHGGGEGHPPIGLKHPKTPWGKPTKGKKTRKQRKKTNKFIVKPRKRGKGSEQKNK